VASASPQAYAFIASSIVTSKCVNAGEKVVRFSRSRPEPVIQ